MTVPTVAYKPKSQTQLLKGRAGNGYNKVVLKTLKYVLDSL